MKKKLLAMLLGCVLMLTVTGCADEEDYYQDSTDEFASEQDDWTEVEEGGDADEQILSQLEAFAGQRDVWVQDLEYADEMYYFAVADLDNDGMPELVVSQCGGTGIYSYNYFYRVNEAGEVSEIAASFVEDDTQPDLIDDSPLGVYSDDAGVYYFIVHDTMKDGPAYYVNIIGALSLDGDYIQYDFLARQDIAYTEEDVDPTVTMEDQEGNPLTEEEYESFADDYFTGQGMTEHVAFLTWVDMQLLDGVSDEEATELLNQSYQGFALE